MNWIPWLLLVLLGLAFLWLIYRHLRLRRALDDYSSTLHRAAVGEMPASAVPTDAPDLEDLSSAITSLFANFHLQLSTLNAENARLATVLEQLTDGVLIADANGLIRFANPAARKLFGTANPIGDSVAAVVRNHQLIEAWRRCQQKREIQSESVELPARRHFLQLFVIPDEHAGGSLLLVQDLTRVRKLETVRRDFISNVSHELRTPLASLKALTETLQNGALADPEAGPRFLGRISTEVDALTQMAQELLDLSRIESGQVELVLEPLAPKRLLSSAADRMKMQVERARLKLTVTCEGELPDIHADRSRLEQVLVNLIHNAVKFTRPGGEIILLAGVADRAVRFAVRDTGIGISSDNLPRVFERFYKSDRSRTSGGTGLGLSIARHIVEAHGGRIWAESVEGRGSTFYFIIPLA